jgi:MarR family transcriptional regulator, organic hydroperoxide resistance regulator
MRPAEEIRYLVLAVQRDGSRRLADALRPLDVTPSQAEVLRVLADYGQLSLSGVGELLVCESGTNPSRLVDRLVAANLVRRDADADDRRQVTLSLTARGKRVADEIGEVEAALYRWIDGAISPTAAKPLISTLRRLAAGSPAGDAVTRRRSGSTKERPIKGVSR